MTSKPLKELVVLSLEPWDEVWRRNQFFTDVLLRRNPYLRVLFVEPPADPLFDLACRRAPERPRFRKISRDGRLRALRPLKPLPRKVGAIVDRAILAQVRGAAGALRYTQPVLWVNDVTFAPLIEATRWPALYDVTDDWLLAPFPPAELRRLKRLDALATRAADEVVVCSPALAESRGSFRAVTLIPNGVDIDHFRRPQARPSDLASSPVAIYVGSLHDSRIDIDLVVSLAHSLPRVVFAFVGPVSLTPDSGLRLAAVPNIQLLGPRPHSSVPGYLQHADAIIVPHRVTPFTESLDPIKAHECLSVTTPTVATPVAGFREFPDEFAIADARSFAVRLSEVLADGFTRSHVVRAVDWNQRGREFEAALLRAAAPANSTASGSQGQHLA